MVGFLLILIIIGFHNYKRIGEFNFIPDGSKTALFIYVAPEILAKKNNSSVSDERKMMDKKARIWIEKSNLDLILNNNIPWEIISGPTKDKKKYYNYLQKQSLEIIFKNPFISIQHVFKQSLTMFRCSV